MRGLVVAVLLAVASGCAAPDTKVYSGHLSIWPEAETFTPCGSKDPLWLDYDQQTREPLAKQHWELQKAPYGKTFARLEGTVGPKLDCGFCESYKGSFKVMRVVEQRASESNDCES